MNRELTGAAINHHLQKIFPELDSIPHADTLARFLETANLKEIEFAHITMIKHTSWERNLKSCLSMDACRSLLMAARSFSGMVYFMIPTGCNEQ